MSTTTRKPMRVYELMRRVSVGPLTLADEEDEPMMLAEKLANTLKGVNAVEVIDEAGNGGLVYPDWP